MVRAINYLVIICLFSSCCDYYLTSMKGLRSKKKFKKYLEKRINPSSVKIDTDKVYKMLLFKYETQNDEFSKIPQTNYNAYILFKKNGNVYSFFKVSRNLNTNSFDSNRANLGYLIKNNQNSYKIVDYSPINCGSFNKNDFKVKGDTLMVSTGINKGYRNWYYYVKQKVPKDWLNWKPDY